MVGVCFCLADLWLIKTILWVMQLLLFLVTWLLCFLIVLVLEPVVCLGIDGFGRFWIAFVWAGGGVFGDFGLVCLFVCFVYVVYWFGCDTC